METRVVAADHPGAIQDATKVLSAGSLVIFSTDTVYGVGADFRNPGALSKIFQAKVRPKGKGLPVLISDKAEMNQVVEHVSAEALFLIEKYWPGPLTLVLPKQRNLPSLLSPNKGIAVRLPDCDIARKVISAAGGAVAVSSANKAGESPSCNVEQALDSLGGLVSLIIDSGPAPGGRASTVLDCLVSPPRLLREGPVSYSELSNFLAIDS